MVDLPEAQAPAGIGVVPVQTAGVLACHAHQVPEAWAGTARQGPQTGVGDPAVPGPQAWAGTRTSGTQAWSRDARQGPQAWAGAQVRYPRPGAGTLLPSGAAGLGKDRTSGAAGPGRDRTSGAAGLGGDHYRRPGAGSTGQVPQAERGGPHVRAPQAWVGTGAPATPDAPPSCVLPRREVQRHFAE